MSGYPSHQPPAPVLSTGTSSSNAMARLSPIPEDISKCPDGEDKSPHAIKETGSEQVTNARLGPRDDPDKVNHNSHSSILCSQLLIWMIQFRIIVGSFDKHVFQCMQSIPDQEKRTIRLFFYLFQKLAEIFQMVRDLTGEANSVLFSVFQELTDVLRCMQNIPDPEREAMPLLCDLLNELAFEVRDRLLFCKVCGSESSKLVDGACGPGEDCQNWIKQYRAQQSEENSIVTRIESK